MVFSPACAASSVAIVASGVVEPTRPVKTVSPPVLNSASVVTLLVPLRVAPKVRFPFCVEANATEAAFSRTGSL